MRIRTMKVPAYASGLFDPPRQTIDFDTPITIEHWQRFKALLYERLAGFSNE